MMEKRGFDSVPQSTAVRMKLKRSVCLAKRRMHFGWDSPSTASTRIRSTGFRRMKAPTSLCVSPTVWIGKKGGHQLNNLMIETWTFERPRTAHHQSAQDDPPASGCSSSFHHLAADEHGPPAVCHSFSWISGTFNWSSSRQDLIQFEIYSKLSADIDLIKHLMGFVWITSFQIQWMNLEHWPLGAQRSSRIVWWRPD